MYVQAKAAWFKMKDMIHTRKDSMKKSSRRQSMSGIEDIEISPEGSSWEDRTTLHSDDFDEILMHDYEMQQIAPWETSSPPTVARSHTVKPIPVSSSPKPIRKRAASVKCPSELAHHHHASPMLMGPNALPGGKRDSVTVMTATGSPIDVTALMGKFI